MGLGLLILNAKSLEIATPGRLQLKLLHAYVGYTLAATVAARLFWAAFGPTSARFRAMLPFYRGYAVDLLEYLRASTQRRPMQFLGHNPMGRIAIAGMLLLLLNQIVTGLVLAGTDLYLPPFGHLFATWVAAPGVDPALVEPYRPELTDAAAVASLDDFRRTFIRMHVYGFYGLSVAVPVHLAGVVLAEVREGGALVSAMITGYKHLTHQPRDGQYVSSDSRRPKADVRDHP